MAIKETPTNFRVYYRLMQERTSKELDKAREVKDKLEEKAIELHKKLEENAYNYIDIFGIYLEKYPEFTQNKYIDGTFYKIAKGLFMNRDGNYKLVSDLYDIYNYGNNQNNIHELEENIKHYNKLLSLSLKDYTEMLRLFYTEVHKKLILEGKGYVFGERIGWICVNRIVLKNNKKLVDYAATKKREKELKEKGIRIYNKEEADWCKANGIEYKAEDKRVYKDNEYCYEIPLIDCKLPGAYDLKLTMTDYRHVKYRGKTNEDLIKDCNNDINKICELQIDLKCKLTLCDKTDKLLYTKFIRNENQKPLTFRKANS